MKSDLRGLARQLGNLLGFCAMLSLVTAAIVFFSGRDPGEASHADAVILLVVLAVQELVVWFGLVYWADQADVA